MATIQQRGGSYRITVSCGYDMEGRQIRKSMTWTPAPGMTAKQIEKELERQKVLFEERCRTGQTMDASIRFAEFAEKWFAEYAEKQLRPKTVARYRSMMPRINAAIGHIRLERLQPHHLIAFYNNLQEPGTRLDHKYRSAPALLGALKDRGVSYAALARMAGVSASTARIVATGAGNVSAETAHKVAAALEMPFDAAFVPASENTALSAKTALHHHRLISAILSTAVQWQVLFSNPCDRVKPPQPEKPAPRYLDDKEAARLLQLLEGEDMQNRTMIKLLLYTGFRRGELLGLEWKDIDFENHLIYVRRSSLYLPDRGIYEDKTKNATSERVIKVQTDAFPMLREFRHWQMERRLAAGDRWEQSDRVFTAADGSPLHPDVLSGWFHDFVKRSGLPDVSIHSLRHTNATLLIAAHIPITTVADRLGHATASTTAKIYAHAIKTADEAAADVLEDILKPASTPHKAG